MSDLSYTSLHWGTSPSRTDDMFFVEDASAEPEGEIAAVSYVTDKGGDPAVFRHEFSKHACPSENRRRGPYLLRVADNGPFKIGAGPENMNAIGQCIDFELTDGRRIFCSDIWLATGRSGNHVYMVSPAKVPFAIEQRPDRPFVTAHGIEE